jgi:hypothetical protein
MYEFIGHRVYEFIRMNEFICHWVYEFIWMNEFTGHRVYEFILLMYEFISGCERAARAARAKPELTSCPDQAAPGCPDR